MTRYRLFQGDQGLEDIILRPVTNQQHDGIVFTPLKEDACEYVTVEKAAQIARELIKLHGYQVHIEVSEDGE